MTPNSEQVKAIAEAILDMTPVELQKRSDYHLCEFCGAEGIAESFRLKGMKHKDSCVVLVAKNVLEALSEQPTAPKGDGLDEPETLEQEIKRLKIALELISFISYKKDPHLGRPRLGDMDCAFCVSQLSLHYGAYGDYLTSEMMSAEIEKRRTK